MKKVYLSALALTGAVMAFGQTVENSQALSYDYAKEFISSDSRPTEGYTSSDRAIIWQNGFDSAGDWTYDGPAAASTAADFGWTVGATTNDWYGFDADMGTTGNFARFKNGDPSTGGTPAPVDGGPRTFEYTGSDVIDLTGICAPHIEFEQYGARFITHQAIEISVDGGTTWIEVGSNDDLPAQTTTSGDVSYAKPMTRRFNISAAVATDPTPTDVRVRFSWDGLMNGATLNYIDYGWFVDNIRIVEGENYDHDIQEAHSRTHLGIGFTEGLEYYKVSTDQISPITFSAETINQGCLLHTGSVATFDVSFGGSSVFTGTSAAVDIPGGAADSVGATGTYSPASGVGTYTVTTTWAGTNADGITTNDELEREFDVTDVIYSRANENQTTSFTNWGGSSAGDPAAIGNEMVINANGVIGAVDVFVDASALDGSELVVTIYRYDGSAYALETEVEYELVGSDPGTYVRVFLGDDELSVVAGDDLLVMAGHYGAQTPIGMAQPTDFGSVVGVDASGGFVTLIDPEAIMIDLVMMSFAGTEELTTSFEIGQNVPNPFDNTSVINYTLDTDNEVSVEIVDITGKVVKSINQGTQAAGDYKITLDANDFAEGSYFYTFTIGEKQVTKRMIITK